jgi:hypothetical protein
LVDPAVSADPDRANDDISAVRDPKAGADMGTKVDVDPSECDDDALEDE